MMCVAKPLRLLLATALLTGMAGVALAQEVADDLRLDETFDENGDVVVPVPRSSRITIGDDEPPVVRRRKPVDDPYAAQGVRAGAFLLFPSIEMTSVASSNPRNATSGAKPDVGLRLKPQLRFESNWVRHSLTGSASLEGRQFLDNTDIKSIGGNAEAALRLDVRHTTRADFDWKYSATSTGLESSELPATATGSRLDQTIDANAGLTHDFGGIEGRLRMGLSRSVYSDVKLTGGGEEDNSDRNYTQVSLSARAALRTGGRLQPFAELTFAPRFHDKKVDRNGLKRDSRGLRLAAGVTFADDPIWTGDLAVTLEKRDYSDSTLNSVVAPGFASNVVWRPTDLTRFEFNGSASLSETVSAGISATKNWAIGVTATHELRENVEVYGGLRGEFERASGETDITTIGSLGVNYTLNPSVVLGGGYEGTFFNGAAAGSDYVDHRLLASIILRR